MLTWTTKAVRCRCTTPWLSLHRPGSMQVYTRWRRPSNQSHSWFWKGNMPGPPIVAFAIVFLNLTAVVAELIVGSVHNTVKWATVFVRFAASAAPLSLSGNGWMIGTDRIPVVNVSAASEEATFYLRCLLRGGAEVNFRGSVSTNYPAAADDPAPVPSCLLASLTPCLPPLASPPPCALSPFT